MDALCSKWEEQEQKKEAEEEEDLNIDFVQP
jgi:hypothetical protein